MLPPLSAARKCRYPARNRRRDFHHKTARALVNQCDVIALEDLTTAGMTRRPAPRPDPENPGTFLANGPVDADVNGARNIASRAGLGSGQAPSAA